MDLKPKNKSKVLKNDKNVHRGRRRGGGNKEGKVPACKRRLKKGVSLGKIGGSTKNVVVRAERVGKVCKRGPIQVGRALF